MGIISSSVDLLYTIDSIGSSVGQSPYKKKTKIDSTGDWKLTDKLNKIKKFEFTVPNDEFHKANVVLERDVTVPFITPFDGIITTRERLENGIKFLAEDQSYHFSRRVFKKDGTSKVIYTDSDWFDKDWKIRIPIEIKTKKLLSQLTSYTIPIHITDFNIARKARFDGFDFLFTDKDGVTQLNHEIESWNPNTGELHVWVQLIKLESESSRTIYLYYANPNSTDQQQIESTWNADYSMVQHMNGNSVDSTLNNNDGTDINISYVDEGFNKSAQFNSVDSRIDCGSGSSIDNIFSGGGTEEFLINLNSDGEGNDGSIFHKGAYSVETIAESGGFVKLRFQVAFATANGIWDSDLIIPLNKSTYCAIIYNSDSVNNDPVIHVNDLILTVGNGLTETQTPVGSFSSDAGNNLYIGNNAGQSVTVDGEIDEVKLSTVEKSETELIFNYNLLTEQPGIIVIRSKENLVKPVDEIAKDIVDDANQIMPIIDSNLIEGLISLWKFDGNVLDSKSTNNGTWVGNEKYSDGIFYNTRCVLFDESSYITTADSPFDFDRTDEFSYFFFIKQTEINGTSYMYITKTSTGLGQQLQVTPDGYPRMRFAGATQSMVFEFQTDIRDGKWHSIGLTKGTGSNASDFTWFHNKVKQTTNLNVISDTLTSESTLNNDVFTIGARSDGTFKSKGNMCGLRVYSKKLSQDEINYLHDSTQHDIDIIQRKLQWKIGDGVIEEIPGLISLWKFDDTLTDTKGENNLSIIGTEQYDQNGWFNSMVYCDGSTYFIATDSDFDFENNNDFAVAFAIKTTSTTRSALVTKQTGLGQLGWGIWMESDGKIIFDMTNTATTNQLRQKGGTAINDGELHYIIVRKNTGLDKTNVSIKIDNQEETLNDLVDTLSSTVLNDIKLYIASDASATDIFTGYLDDVRIYDNYVSDRHTKRLFDATTSGVDFIRNDDVVQNIIPLEFNDDKSLEALEVIAKSVGTDIYFDNKEYRVLLRRKGKTIEELLDVVVETKPRQTLNKVTNILNVTGDKDENDIPLEKQFTVDEETRYTYETSVVNSKIKTSGQLNNIGNNILQQFKSPIDEIPATIPYEQFVRFDLQSGDIIKISDPKKETNSKFRITSIVATPQKVKLTMRDTKNSVTFTDNNDDISTVIQGLISRIDDINKS